MFRDFEKTIHKRGSPFFHIFHEFEILKDWDYRKYIHLLHEINIASKRRESSSHISLIQFFISDISESSKCLELILFGIFGSEDIFRTIYQDAIACSEFLDIGRFSMIGLDKSSCDPALCMFETNTDDIVFIYSHLDDTRSDK